MNTDQRITELTLVVANLRQAIHETDLASTRIESLESPILHDQLLTIEHHLEQLYTQVLKDIDRSLEEIKS